MDTAGVDVKLAIYEGMIDVFQAVPGMLESEIALAKVKNFLELHLENK